MSRTAWGPTPRCVRAAPGIDRRRALRLARPTLLLVIVALLNLLLAPRTGAEVVADLHMAEVAVTGNSEAERVEAIRAGFVQVAIKRTGAPDLAGGRALTLLSELAVSLLAREELLERAPGPSQSDGKAGDQRPNLLRLWFKPAETDAVLKGAGLDLWAPDRPRVLLLVTINAGEAAGTLALSRTSEAGAPVRALLLRAAQLRGLPVVLPESDATDQRIFSSQAARRDPLFPVRMLKARYGAEAVAVLLLELNQGASTWDGHWDLGIGPATGTGSLSGVSLDRAIGHYVDGLVRALAGRPR